MNRLNRKVEYALIALKHMSGKEHSELSTAKEIAERYGCPFDATARVLQIMASEGWLQVEHGACGGYSLSADLQELSFKALIDLIQGPSFIAKCQHDKGSKSERCEIQHHCNIISPIQTLNRKLAEFYSSLSLRELLVDWSTNERKASVHRAAIARGVM